MPGKCSFQDHWIRLKDYKDWILADPKDRRQAKCRLCVSNINFAAKAHMKSAKHKKNVKENMGAIGVDQFYSSESISNAEPGPSTSACSTSSSKQAHIRLITVSPQNFYE